MQPLKILAVLALLTSSLFGGLMLSSAQDAEAVDGFITRHKYVVWLGPDYDKVSATVIDFGNAAKVRGGIDCQFEIDPKSSWVNATFPGWSGESWRTCTSLNFQGLYSEVRFNL